MLEAPVKKIRLDKLLCEQYPDTTRSRIRLLIKQGAVIVNGVVCTKPGILVSASDDISVDFAQVPFVSRAGQKLAHALDYFDYDVAGMRVLDAGLSTGGFADCLLQRGAAHVYGIDVGTAQVHERLRSESNLTIAENTDIRTVTLQTIDGLCVDLITLDLSFISLTHVFDAVLPLICDGGSVIALIKPQFEVGKKVLAKSGLVKDKVQHDKVVLSITDALNSYGFSVKGVTESPILGGSGNKEFLIMAKKGHM